MPSKTGLIITFSGLDGAGKTTQANMLRKQFEARQIPYRHISPRIGWTTGIIALRRFFHFKKNKLPVPGKDQAYPVNQRKPISIQQKIFRSISMLDLARTFLIISFEMKRKKKSSFVTVAYGTMLSS